LGVNSRGKKGKKGPEGLGVGSGARIDIEKKTCSRQGELAKPAAGWAAVAKEICWVGAAAYILCSSPTLHNTSYSTQKSKPQHSGVTGAHASEAARRAWAPGRTDMLARAMGITCVEDLPDPDHMVWEVKEPATAKPPTWLLLL